MFGLGFSHLILLGILGLIFIGPEELPQVARTLGRFLNELKRGGENFTDELKRSAQLDEPHIHPPEQKIESAPETAAQPEKQTETTEVAAKDGHE